MDQYFFKVPFALGGDQTSIPRPIDGSGAVSFTQGHGPDYQRDQLTDPLAKPLDRGTLNFLYYAITGAVQQYQIFGTPEFISTADNDGVAYSYAKGARVRYRVSPSDPWNVYESKVDANAALPTVTTNWQLATYLTLAEASASYLTAATAAATYAIKNNSVLTGTTNAQDIVANNATINTLLTAPTVASLTIFVNNIAGGGGGGGAIGVGAILNTAQVAPQSDNFYSCGRSGARWSVVYAGSGTINTSDARDKSDVRALLEQEIAAAIALSREIGAYTFLAALQEKGKGARVHIGMTVQRAIVIMRNHDLDPFGYGFICYDEWDEEIVQAATPATYSDTVNEAGEIIDTVEVTAAIDERRTPAGNRYGFRMDELLAFVAVGFERRLSILEARA